ncbi:hypothetical protein [Streptomyces diastatochromogenes]|nr:hypothetical protein [Streptomyces diastatochromogenes]MCZ0987885.1 hypothetical protein [Streptomyces diastatochromogenes]
MTLLALGIGVTPALAQNPHFIGDPTCSGKTITSNRASITCSGSVAGLGTGKVAIFLTADSVRATYLCVNKGGNTAPGHPAIFQDLAGPTQTITPRQGRVNFSVVLQTPPNPSPKDAGCPNNNWRVVLTTATFNNVVLHVEQPVGTEILHADFGNIDPS